MFHLETVQTADFITVRGFNTSIRGLLDLRCTPCGKLALPDRSALPFLELSSAKQRTRIPLGLRLVCPVSLCSNAASSPLYGTPHSPRGPRPVGWAGPCDHCFGGGAPTVRGRESDAASGAHYPYLPAGTAASWDDSHQTARDCAGADPRGYAAPNRSSPQRVESTATGRRHCSPARSVASKRT
jgi:hypothetical protein